MGGGEREKKRQTALFARRAPTIKPWSLDARNIGMDRLALRK
jgi:hypothetical protein